MKCPKCGKRLESAAFYCEECGWLKRGLYIASVDDEHMSLYVVPPEDTNMVKSMTYDVPSVTATLYNSNDIQPSNAISSSDTEYDPLLSDAVETCFQYDGLCSTSILQRTLKLGYLHAARIVEQMEELGFIEPYDGHSVRKLIITKSQWDKMYMFNPSAEGYQE